MSRDRLVWTCRALWSGPAMRRPRRDKFFRTLAAFWNQQGAGFDNVVEFTTYVVGRDSVRGFIDGRNQVFPDIFPNGDYPPNTLLVVNGLVRDEFLVEIKAVAALA